MRRFYFLILCLPLLALEPAAFDFSLSLHGGWSWFEGGDLNRHISGWHRYLEDRASPDFSSAFKFDELHGLTEFGADAALRLSTRWKLGLEVGYLSQKRTGEVSTRLSLQRTHSTPSGQTGLLSLTETTSQLPSYSLEVIPLTLKVSCGLLSAEKWRLSVSAGAGIYWGKLFYQEDYQYDFDSTDDQHSGDSYVRYLERYSSSGRYTEESRSVVVGFQGGATLDIRISEALDFVFEILGRWVELGDWDGRKTDAYDWSQTWGAWGESSAQGQNEESYSGKLWRVDFQSGETGKSYPRLAFSETEPVSSFYTNQRPAQVSLSGFSARFGFRVWFGKAG